MDLTNNDICKEAPLLNEYQSYLLDYFADVFDAGGILSEYCLFRVDYNQAILYVKTNRPLSGRNRDLRYSMVPKCYGLMETRELEQIGVGKVRRSPLLGFRGQGTLIAVIDTGIDLTDPLFLYEDGTTKVAAFWDQTQEGSPPEEFYFGNEWTEENINDVLREGITNPQADAVFPQDENGHGTFLSAVAAGREMEDGFSGVAPDATLVVVKLKQAKQYLRDFYSIPEDVWACQEDDVMLAVRYVLTVARRLQKPISICLGIGTNMGGHGGTNGLARYISFVSLLPGVSIHIASGNEGISNHHFDGLVPENDEFLPVEIHVAEGENGFIMELWGNAPNIYSVAFLSPGGERVERIQLKLNEFRSIQFFPEGTLLEIRSYPGETLIGEEVIRMNFKNPTPGLWKMYVYTQGNGDRAFDIWMPINQFIKDDTFFLGASPDETITSPGNAFYGITYVPYDVDTDSLYVRASRGYTRDGRVKPDIAAPGVSVEIPQEKTGGVRNLTGSSIAAAYGAGMGSLIQEWAIVKNNDPSMNGQNMKAYLIQGAKRTNALVYPNRQWGYGQADVYESFLSLRR